MLSSFSGLLRKYRLEIVISLFLILAFWATRLTNLTILPIFTDEAIYLRWAQIAWHDASWRFISLTDGKQPLFTWLVIPFMKFIQDPLYAGRLLSVFAGFGSVIGIWLLTWELFKAKKASFLASALYIFIPFFLFYDRMALVDSMLTMFGIWVFWLGILLAKHPRLDIALILGMVLGFALLTKSPASFYMYLLPSTVLFLDFRKKKKIQTLLLWFGLLLVTIIISQGIYNVMRLSPMMHMIAIKNSTFLVTKEEFISHPFQFLLGNLDGLLDWLRTWLTKPVFYLGLISLLFGIIKYRKEKLFLTIYFIMPLLAEGSFAKVLYPRYVLFFSPPLVIAVAEFFSELIAASGKFAKQTTRKLAKIIIAVSLFILFFPMAKNDYKIVTDPVNAAIHPADRGQYLDNWPGGEGVKETVVILKEQAKTQKIAVFTDGTFGLMPFALELYLWDNKNITLKGLWPISLDGAIPKEIEEKAKTIPTYIVFNEIQKVPEHWPISLIGNFRKGHGNIYLRLYEVIYKGK